MNFSRSFKLDSHHISEYMAFKSSEALTLLVSIHEIATQQRVTPLGAILAG